METAYKYSIKACEQGYILLVILIYGHTIFHCQMLLLRSFICRNIFACANTSRMYHRGEGVEKNAELAEVYKKRVIEMEKQQNANFKPIELQRQ